MSAYDNASRAEKTVLAAEATASDMSKAAWTAIGYAAAAWAHAASDVAAAARLIGTNVHQIGIAIETALRRRG